MPQRPSTPLNRFKNPAGLRGLAKFARDGMTLTMPKVTATGSDATLPTPPADALPPSQQPHTDARGLWSPPFSSDWPAATPRRRRSDVPAAWGVLDDLAHDAPVEMPPGGAEDSFVNCPTLTHIDEAWFRQDETPYDRTLRAFHKRWSVIPNTSNTHQRGDLDTGIYQTISRGQFSNTTGKRVAR